MRRTYHERDAELAQGDHTEVWVEEVWLSSSPDCKPFDYFVRGVSELRVKAKSHNKYKDLIQKMKEVMGSLARDTLAKACTSFRSRSEALVTADGSFIEYVDCQYLCGGSGMFIPDPRSRILIFTHPGSRIPDLGSRIQKQQQKKEVKKN